MSTQATHADDEVKTLNARLANPLAGFTHAELATKAEEYCRSHEIGDEEDIRAFRLGAIIAQVRHIDNCLPMHRIAYISPDETLIWIWYQNSTDTPYRIQIDLPKSRVLPPKRAKS